MYVYIYISGWWSGLEHEFYFPFHIWDVILPIEELIFFRGVGIPPTIYIQYTVYIYILIISNICIVLLGSMFGRDVLWFDSLENWGLGVSNVVYRSMFWTKTWNHINHHVQKVNDIPPKKMCLGISVKISQRLGKLNPPIAEGILKSPANLLSFQRWFLGVLDWVKLETSWDQWLGVSDSDIQTGDLSLAQAVLLWPDSGMRGATSN